MEAEEWMKQFKKHLVERYAFTPEQAGGYDFTDYQDYYNDGYSPVDACDEDMSYAEWEPPTDTTEEENNH